MRSLLFPHEWLAVLMVCMTVLGLACFSWNHYSDSLPIPLDEEWVKQEEKIEVTIEGAVQHPGSYSLPQGSQLKVLLAQAKPLAESDLRSLKKNQKLRNGQCVKVPERSMVTVYLSGAVERPGAYQVREGTPLSALPEVCLLAPNAELGSLRAKRSLRAEERIYIPYKAD